MKFKYCTYLFYFIAVILCPSCCCRKTVCPTFTEDQKSWISNFNKGDTIKFMSNLGDKVNFVVDAIIEEQKDEKNKQGPFPGCYDYCLSLIRVATVQTVANPKVPNFKYQIENKEGIFDFKVYNAFRGYESTRPIFSLEQTSTISNLNIGGKIFENAYLYNIDPLQQENFTAFWLTKEYGIVKFQYDKDEYYERQF